MFYLIIVSIYLKLLLVHKKCDLLTLDFFHLGLFIYIALF
jgi:hypothetical protein